MQPVVTNDTSLKPYNTFGFDIRAEHFVETQNDDEICDAIAWASKHNKTIFAIGCGSNLVLTKNVAGLVIALRNESIYITEDTDHHAIVYASGGSIWNQVVSYCIENNLYGIENLSLIPGTAGAAPIQNIGAFGVELSETIIAVEALKLDTRTRVRFNKADCQFGYRESIFKRELHGQYIITGLFLKLRKTATLQLEYKELKMAFKSVDPNTITLKDVNRTICEIRNKKLPNPDLTGNVGSFFKNPIISEMQFNQLSAEYGSIPAYPLLDNFYKIPAAWLVEIAGWKGYMRGNIGVHDKQSIVLVNYGEGTGKEILQLAEDIMRNIEDRFSINLEIEPICR